MDEYLIQNQLKEYIEGLIESFEIFQGVDTKDLFNKVVITIKKQIFLFCLIVAGLLIVLFGFILSVNLIPIQDFDPSTMTKIEEKNFLNEMALNYPLGKLLVKVGLVIFIPSLFGSVYLLLKKLMKQANK